MFSSPLLTAMGQVLTGAEDSKVMAPAIKKLTPVRVRPINREQYTQHGKYHDKSFQMELWKYKTETSQKNRKRLSGGGGAWVGCERMNKGKPGKRTGRPFPSEGKEGGGRRSWNSQAVWWCWTRSEKPGQAGKRASWESGLGATGWPCYCARNLWKD